MNFNNKKKKKSFMTKIKKKGLFFQKKGNFT